MNEIPDIITNKQLKYIRSLSNSKYRKKYNRYMLEGDKICMQFIDLRADEIEYLLALDQWIHSNKNLLTDKGIKTIAVDERVMSTLSTLKTATDVIIIAEKKVRSIKDIIKPKFKAVYLDDVQDPGNVGSIIRTASWFGFDAVIRSSGSADFHNPKVIQSTMGGFLYLDLVEMDISELDSSVTNLYFIGTAMDGIAHTQQMELPDQWVVVIGNEGKGMRSETKKLMDKVLSIRGVGHVESLNASVAFGIIASRISSDEDK